MVKYQANLYSNLQLDRILSLLRGEFNLESC